MGYPLIEVRCENNTVKATQERFLLNPADNETGVDVVQSPFKYKWYVPLTYVTDAKPRTMQLVWMNMSDCKPTTRAENRSFHKDVFEQCDISFYSDFFMSFRRVYNAVPGRMDKIQCESDWIL